MVANGVKHPPEGCHPEGIEGSGFDEGVGRRKGRDVSTPLDMTGILIIRVHPWLVRGSTTRKEAKTAQNGGRNYEKREIHENGAETGLKTGDKLRITRMTRIWDRKPNPCPSVFIRGWIGVQVTEKRRECLQNGLWGPKMASKWPKWAKNAPKQPFLAMSRNGAGMETPDGVVGGSKD